MRADAHGLAVVKDDYFVRVAYCADALGDYQAGGAAELALQPRAERGVGAVVERGEGVVED